MKVVAINGSPKAKGNTYTSLEVVGKELKESGIEFEIIHIGNQPIRGCLGCGGCMRNQNEECVIKDDCLNEVVQKLKDADGIILGSPVYFSGVNGTMKSLLDRLFYVAMANGAMFRHKVGASVAAVRRSGGVATFDELNHYLLFSEMMIPSSNYWNAIHGGAPGEVLQDVEGVQILRVLGKNMAWMMKLMEAGKNTVLEPAREDKEFMSFIH